jgi:hypothetical protein
MLATTRHIFLHISIRQIVFTSRLHTSTLTRPTGPRQRLSESLYVYIKNLYLLEAPRRHRSARSQTRGGSFRVAGAAAQHKAQYRARCFSLPLVLRLPSPPSPLLLPPHKPSTHVVAARRTGGRTDSVHYRSHVAKRVKGVSLVPNFGNAGIIGLSSPSTWSSAALLTGKRERG